MTNFTLEATLKTETGTGASRRLRKTGKIPAIIYGKNTEATAIAIEHDKLLHAIEEKSFFESTIKINIEGKEEQVKIQALQRHPYKVKLLHADFIRV